MIEFELDAAPRAVSTALPAQVDDGSDALPIAPATQTAAEAQIACLAQVERVLAVTRRYFAAPLADGEHPAIDRIDPLAARRARRSGAILAHRRRHAIAARTLARRQADLVPA